MALLYSVVNERLPIATLDDVRAYSRFMGRQLRELSGLTFRGDHQFCFAINDRPIGHWDYLTPESDGMIFYPPEGQIQKTYLAHDQRTVSRSGLQEAVDHLKGTASGIIDLRQKLVESPSAVITAVKDRMKPVTDERGVTKQRQKAFAVIWDLDRLVRLYEAQEFYVSIVVK